MKPLLPRIRWPNIVIYIPSAIVGYAVYFLVIWLAVRYGLHTHPYGVIEMIEYIDTFVLILAVAIPVLWALIMSFTRFIGNKKDIAVAEKKAKLEGGAVVDTVNAQLAEKYWFGYAILGILGALACAGLALFIGDILAGRGYLVGDEEIAFATIAIAVVLEIVADCKIINSLGDIGFFLRKEQQAIETFLHPVEPVADEEMKAEPKSDVEQIAELLAQVLAKK